MGGFMHLGRLLGSLALQFGFQAAPARYARSGAFRNKLSARSQQVEKPDRPIELGTPHVARRLSHSRGSATADCQKPPRQWRVRRRAARTEFRLPTDDQAAAAV